MITWTIRQKRFHNVITVFQSGFTVITEAGPIGTFDLLELEYALNNAGPLMKPYIINAVNQFMDDLAAGLPMVSTEIFLEFHSLELHNET